MTRIAVVGAGGCVGEAMLELLEKEGLSGEPPILYGSERSRGREISYGGERLPCRVLEEGEIEGVDIALFAAGAATSRRWARSFRGRGAAVIDNSSAFRMEPEVPLVVPEINPESVPSPPAIIANPNCSTIILLLALHPLRPLGDFRVVASTYQAVSGAGRAGLEALERERAGGAFERGKPFPFPIEGNLFPLIGDPSVVDGLTVEERKMVQESRKILGWPDLQIQVTCVRVPVERCHSIAATLIFDGDVKLEHAAELLRKAPGVRLEEDPELPPTPGPLAGEEGVSVGRLRRPAPAVLQLWIVGDQILKGAALNAVQIARLCLER
ncbi:MAG: aspartate-semialdehyde dehydrogenase [Planctomycetota bacterium]